MMHCRVFALKQNTLGLSFVAFSHRARKDGRKCPIARMKMTFCLDATPCVSGESMTLLVG